MKWGRGASSTLQCLLWHSLWYNWFLLVSKSNNGKFQTLSRIMEHNNTGNCLKTLSRGIIFAAMARRQILGLLYILPASILHGMHHREHEIRNENFYSGASE